MIPLSKLDFESGAFTSLAKYLRRHWPKEPGPQSLSDAQEALSRILGYEDLHQAQQMAGKADAMEFPPNRRKAEAELAWGVFKECHEKVAIEAAMDLVRKAPMAKLWLWRCFSNDAAGMGYLNWEECQVQRPATEGIRWHEFEMKWREKHTFENQRYWFERCPLPLRLVKAGITRGVVSLKDGRVIVGDAIGLALDVVSASFAHKFEDSDDAAMERMRLMNQRIIPQATMSLDVALRRYGDRAMPSWLSVFAVLNASGSCIGLALKNMGVQAYYATLLDPSVDGLVKGVGAVLQRQDRLIGEATNLASESWTRVRLVAIDMQTSDHDATDDRFTVLDQLNENPITDGEDAAWGRVYGGKELHVGEMFDMGGARMTRENGLPTTDRLRQVPVPFKMDEAVLAEVATSPEWIQIRKLVAVLPGDVVHAAMWLKESLWRWDDANIDDAAMRRYVRDVAAAIVSAGLDSGSKAEVAAWRAAKEDDHQLGDPEGNPAKTRGATPKQMLRREWSDELLRLLGGELELRELRSGVHVAGVACRLIAWWVSLDRSGLPEELPQLREALAALEDVVTVGVSQWESIEISATQYMEEVADWPFARGPHVDYEMVMACGW